MGASPGGATWFRRKLVAPAVVVVVLVGFGAFIAYGNLIFGTFSLVGPPPRVIVCGDSYNNSGETISTPHTLALHRVGTTLSGLPILGNAACGHLDAAWVFVGIHGKLIPYREAHCVLTPTCFSEPYTH
ncbi:MAG: hypothetical protein ACYDHU_03130 [Acidimicrobiales bacterium]